MFKEPAYRPALPIPVKKKPLPTLHVPEGGNWLRTRDSNPEWLIQSQQCYHYTSPQGHGSGYFTLL